MAPRIQYARRSDGVRTAYATMGAGPVLIVPPGGTTHLDWYLGNTRAQELFCARLAERRTLVLYDRHGCGLSDRNRKDFTPEDDMLDMEAVVAAIDSPTFDLFGISWGGNPAIAYAARNPERVPRLVLYGTGADGPLSRGPEYEARSAALDALRRSDWDLYCRTQASRFFPSGTDQETFQSLVRMHRDSTTSEMAEKLDAVRFDNQSLLSDIQTPTMVIHRRGDEVCLFSWGQYMARRLPNCRFIPLEGDAHYPWVDDADSVLRPMIEFLTEADDNDAELAAAKQGGAVATGAQPAVASPAGMVTILFTDMEGSTALAQRVGDAAAQEVRRAHNEIVRTALSEQEGSEIKHTGDGIMASFATASAALNCAIAIQRGVAAHKKERPDSPLGVYIGLNAGEPIAEDGDLFGTSVDLAARICGHAEPGQIVVSNVVRELAAGKGFLFSDRGETELRGFEEPVRLYEVRWREEG